MPAAGKLLLAKATEKDVVGYEVYLRYKHGQRYGQGHFEDLFVAGSELKLSHGVNYKNIK